MAPAYPVEMLWCSNRSLRARKNGWSFPPAVRRRILADSEGLTVVHFFGGLADFGVRLDIDPVTKPDVMGDAWLPPFARDSFDVVVLDPPYIPVNQQEKCALLNAAGYVARRRVVWFHTIWIASDSYLVPEKAWLVRVGDTAHVRCLQYFRVARKRPLMNWFSRGPAMKYNRWLVQPEGLSFGGSA